MTRRPTRPARRRGTILPILALTGTALFAFVALAIDLGLLTVARNNCQNAVDGAALASVRQLNNKVGVTDNNSSAATTTAQTVVQNNKLLRTNFTAYTGAPTTADQKLTVTIGQYTYNSTAQRFVPDFTSSLGTGASWTAVKVAVSANQPTFFAKVVGIGSMPTGAYATAVHRPRDIAIVLDFSASMRFGSMPAWENGYTGAGGVNYGLLNPDPNYPQFGHYGRYTAYQVTNPSSAVTGSSTAAASRPNPLRMTEGFEMSTGDVTAPNNHTVETPGGPPVVFDFRFDPSNKTSPTTKVTTPNAM